jgi:hypothetical protein
VIEMLMMRPKERQKGWYLSIPESLSEYWKISILPYSKKLMTVLTFERNPPSYPENNRKKIFISRRRTNILHSVCAPN